MSTGYGWEGLRQVCATLFLVRAMYLSASAVAVYTYGRYNKLTFTSTLPHLPIADNIPDFRTVSDM